MTRRKHTAGPKPRYSVSRKGMGGAKPKGDRVCSRVIGVRVSDVDYAKLTEAAAELGPEWSASRLMREGGVDRAKAAIWDAFLRSEGLKP